MGHTYASNFIHCVFSTKGRKPLLGPDRIDALYAYFGGIAKGEGLTLIAVVEPMITFTCCSLCLRHIPSHTQFRNSKEVPLI